jgi:porin
LAGWYALAGFGGSIPFEVRQNDKFGEGFFYKGLSSRLKDALQPLLRDEYGMEVFYNLALTPWLRVTGDVQVIRPVLTNRDTAVFFGLRTQVVF